MRRVGKGSGGPANPRWRRWQAGICVDQMARAVEEPAQLACGQTVRPSDVMEGPVGRRGPRVEDPSLPRRVEGVAVQVVLRDAERQTTSQRLRRGCVERRHAHATCHMQHIHVTCHMYT